MSERRMNGENLEIYSDGKLVLTLQEKLTDDVMHMKVSGEIRNDVAHDFEDEMMAIFSVCNNVTLDLGGVTYMASLAMRTLLSVQQLIDENDNATLIITNLSAPAKEMFESSGFLEILNIES